VNFLDIIQTTGIIASLLFTIWQIRFQIQATKITHYSQLDSMCGDLLKLAIEKPYLRNPQTTFTPEQQQEYNHYAHLVWCFVETIYDHASADKNLMEVWHSAMEIENSLHREWFDHPENKYKFRPKFREYVNKMF